jgi:hypothetical protein
MIEYTWVHENLVEGPYEHDSDKVGPLEEKGGKEERGIYI